MPIELEMLLSFCLEHMRVHGGLGECKLWSGVMGICLGN